jgi:kinesin family protein C2/C3
MPLRKITNFIMPPPSPLQKQKTGSVLSSMHDKENNPRTTTAGANTKSLVKPRRMSVAVRPPPPMSAQVFQPKRRVSIATHRSEPASNMTTPLQTSQYKNGNVVGRQTFVRDPRKPRNSKLFSPLPEFRTASETTPTVMRTSSKFMGSPPAQAGSWKPKHPTAVALQRKSLVWSPLKLRSFQNRRPSLLPYRPSSTNEVQ